MGRRTLTPWILGGALVSASAALVAACGSDAFTGVDGDAGPADGTAPGLDGVSPGDTGRDDDGGERFDGQPGFDAPPGPDSIAPPPEGGCGETPVTSAGSFVATTTTNPGSGDCTPQAPCPTIGQGIAWAQKNARQFVYVEKGTYVEQVKLAAGITVRGGWARDDQGQWQIICDGAQRVSAVVIQAPDIEIITALADALSGAPAGLDTINLHSRAAAAQAGQSFYGLVVRGVGTAVTLKEVAINVKTAGNGAPGGTGGGGAAAPGSCSAGGAGAAPGTTGPGGMRGTFDVSGYTPGDGQSGGSGTQGSNGSTLTTHACTDGGPCAACVWESPEQGLPPQCDPAPDTNVCGTDAVWGCGSGGGGGGSPGRGGGSSIALYVWGGAATIEASVLGGGSGGGGGQGGPGGGPGAPTSAVQGQAGTCYNPSSASCAGTSGQTCHATGPSSTTVAGGTASNGAPGGTGGSGGGGSGGSSYAYYTGGGGTVTVLQNVSLQPGVAGPGGPTSTGAASGAQGTAAQHN